MIIGLAGRKRSGKTTAAKILQKIVPNSKIVSFASPIKEMSRVFLKNFVDEPDDYLFGDKKDEFVPHINMTGRKVMQTIGTEWGRNIISEDVWIDLMRHRVNQEPDVNFIIDDIRFPNEMNFVLRMQGIFIRIERKEYFVDDHVSERFIDSLSPEESLSFADHFKISNNGSVNDLENELRQILDRVEKRRDRNDDAYWKLIKDLFEDDYINDNKTFVVKYGEDAGKLLTIDHITPVNAYVKTFIPSSDFDMTFRSRVGSYKVTHDELREMLGI